MLQLLPLLLAAGLLPARLDCVWPTGFVKSEGPRLVLGGREYRAVGVNVPHLSQAYAGTWFHWREIYGTRSNMRRSVV
jgi:hypothetical protein